MIRGVDDLLADLAEAVDAAAELVNLGKLRRDSERPLRLAGEAVIGRLGDIATKLPDEVLKATPEIPWREVKGNEDHRRARLPSHRLRRGLGHLAGRRSQNGRCDQALAAGTSLITPNKCRNNGNVRGERDVTAVCRRTRLCWAKRQPTGEPLMTAPHAGQPQILPSPRPT